MFRQVDVTCRISAETELPSRALHLNDGAVVIHKLRGSLLYRKTEVSTVFLIAGPTSG